MYQLLEAVDFFLPIKKRQKGTAKSRDSRTKLCYAFFIVPNIKVRIKTKQKHPLEKL